MHVHSLEQALSLIDHSSSEVIKLFKELAAKYWPGPLTLVVKANLEVIPALVTAQTGFVGIRMPNNAIAMDLLKTSTLPVAAPSANKFGHVSPTKAEHVYKDFHSDSEVLIIDGGSCSFGIESTVMKICYTTEQEKPYELCVIRKGGISLENLNAQIEDSGLADNVFVTQLGQKHSKEETEKLEAPGQFLRHYSPDIVSYLFTGSLSRDDLRLEQAILLDFGGIYFSLKD